nr:GGDEF domain-containing phosphodiesterase [Wenzhouxiangella limi]
MSGSTWLALFVLMIALFALFYWRRLSDIKDLKHAVFEARKLKIAVDQSPASIVITDCNGKIEYANRTCIENTGYSREELIGQNPRVMQSGQTPKEVYADLWATIKLGRTWQGRLVNRRKDGSEYVERVLINPVLDAQDQPIRFIAVKEDITEREALDQRLQSLEYFDALTGLANRYSFIKELEQRLGQVRPGQMHQALALVNIDRFHGFNLTYGHEAADRLLQLVARRLVEQVPEDSMVARIGPDEFAILPPLATGSDTRLMSPAETKWIQRVQRALREGYSFVDRTRVVGSSIGFAVCDGVCDGKGKCDPGGLMRMADTALHSAKAQGGGQVAFFDAESSHEAEQLLRLEQHLARALDKEELHVALQSQVDPSGKLAGVEILLRWHHAGLGDIAPVRFIPLAEDSGQIVPIGYWVLEQALEILGYLQAKEAALTVSVNISPVQIQQADFVEAVKRRLDARDVNASGLILEVTERIFMDAPELAMQRLRALRDLGVGISIDDFGTGYSSLAYLKRLPVTELKIDREFVRGLPNDPADCALVNIMISAAKQLKLRVVAEGIESAAQAEFFDDLPELLLQGYLYDRPTAFVEWSKKWM